jgi:hypothetical protein
VSHRENRNAGKSVRGRKCRATVKGGKPLLIVCFSTSSSLFPCLFSTGSALNSRIVDSITHTLFWATAGGKLAALPLSYTSRSQWRDSNPRPANPNEEEPPVPSALFSDGKEGRCKFTRMKRTSLPCFVGYGARSNDLIKMVRGTPCAPGASY